MAPINRSLPEILSDIVGVSFLLFCVSACHKEKENLKFPSFYNYISSDEGSANLFVYNGIPGFFMETVRQIPIDNMGKLESSSDYGKRINLNLTACTFSEALVYTADLKPPRVTERNYINQINNVNYFMRLKVITAYSAAGVMLYEKNQIYVANSSFTQSDELKPPDSTYLFGALEPMADGRFLVCWNNKVNSSIKQKLLCYNSNFSVLWNKDLPHSSDSLMASLGLEIFGNYIYVLQGLPYNWVESRTNVTKFDLNGNLVSVYPDARKNITNFHLYENNSGYYLFGTSFLNEKGYNDFNIINVDAGNVKTEEHVLHIFEYLPEWLNHVASARELMKMGAVSSLIKTTTGWCFAIAYPDLKNKNSLALVKLNTLMQVESVKTIARNIGNTYLPVQSVSLKSANNKLYLLWNLKPNNYFYVLDIDGKLVHE